MLADLFIIRALIAGIAVAILVGFLGCFVVWRKMAYFGDSLSHSALLGIALGLFYSVDVNLSVIVVCTLFAVILTYLQQNKILATDSLLGILAHSSLALGMVIISFIKNKTVDIHSYLFGDILTVTNSDIYLIIFCTIIVLALLLWNFSSLVLLTISQDLAKVKGIKIFFMQLLLMFLMTLVVAISINIVGILLITSMLIIPASCARFFSKDIKQMAIISSLIGVISVIAGITSSIHFDVPTGPAIIVSATSIFVLSIIFSRK